MGWNKDRTMFTIDDTKTIPDMNKIMKIVKQLEEDEERKKFLPAGYEKKELEMNVYDLNPTKEEFEIFLFKGYKDKEDYIRKASEEMRIRDYIALLWHRGRKDEAQDLLEEQSHMFILNWYPEGLNNLSGEPVDQRY